MSFFSSDHCGSGGRGGCRAGDIVGDGSLVVPHRSAQLPPSHRSHGSERRRNLESKSPRARRRGDGTRIGNVPLRSGTLYANANQFAEEVNGLVGHPPRRFAG